MQAVKFGHDFRLATKSRCWCSKNMSESSAKNKKTKSKKVKLIAKRPGKIVAAVKTWVKSAEKSACDALNMDGAPAWAENALAEAVKVILPSKCLPTDGKMSLDLLGELAGRQDAIAKLFEGEIPMGGKMQADYELIKKHEASLPQTRQHAARKQMLAKDVTNIKKANQQAIPELMRSVLASSHEDAKLFQKGLLRGMNLAPEELEVAKILQRHTETFWEIGLNWRKYYKCRSVAEVHRKLCAEYGETKIGSLKHFECRIAKKIGMKFSRSGRPVKLK
jgi:hypothetical protein